MSYTTIEVFLLLPHMTSPKRVDVSVRQLFFLDQHAERTTGSEGQVIYKLGSRFVIDDTIYLPDHSGKAAEAISVPL